MTADRDIAQRVAELQNRGRDYALIEIPAYMSWSERKLDAGESPALIANLDGSSMFLLPEEVAAVSEDDFEELLSDLKDEVGDW